MPDPCKQPDPKTSSPTVSPRWLPWALSLLIVLLVVWATLVPKARLSRWFIEPSKNTNMAEAMAWLNGRLDLPERYWDTAFFEGKVYNVYPPAFTFISLMAMAPQKAVLEPDQPTYIVPTFMVAVLFLPLPLLGFWMFARCTQSPAWSAVWTMYWLVGSPMLPVVMRCSDGGMYFVNHVLSQIGLLLVLGGLLGRRRLGLVLFGLVLAVWSRQLTFAYLVPVVYVILTQLDLKRRLRWLTATALTAVLIVGVLLALNTLKFGHPLHNGYKLIYEGFQPETHARVQEHGLFNLRYLPVDLWYLFFAVPTPQVELYPSVKFDWVVSEDGASIFFTTPVLLFVLIDIRRWWREPFVRWLMLATVPVLAALLTYHNTGWLQPGFHRFALDFLLPWMVVISRRPITPRRAWVIAAMLAWSVAYFQMF